MGELIQFHLAPEFMQQNQHDSLSGHKQTTSGISLGTLHSSFDHAVNFCFSVDGEERMVTVLKEGTPLLPDSLIVSAPFFLYIKKHAGETVSIQHQCFSVGNRKLKLDPECAVDLFLPHMAVGKRRAAFLEHCSYLKKFIESQEKHSDLLGLPHRFQELAVTFADCLIRGEAQGIQDAFEQLVGAGKGLTPACDDAMVGVLAAVCFYRKTLPQGILDILVREHRTTKVSEKYLKCACRGMVSWPLVQLLQWIFQGSGSFPEKEVLQIVQMGHTSGMDTLYGVQCVLSLLAEETRG